jgi:uncharacterized integral membrane protein
MGTGGYGLRAHSGPAYPPPPGGLRRTGLIPAGVESLPEVAVKAARIIQLVLVALAALYLWLFHSANPDYVELPYLSRILPPLPVGLVVVVTLLVGWLVGWLPTRIALWRRGRDVRRLEAALAEERRRHAVEPVPLNPYLTEPEIPVIPDRPYDPALEDPDEAA